MLQLLFVWDVRAPSQLPGQEQTLKRPAFTKGSQMETSTAFYALGNALYRRVSGDSAGTGKTEKADFIQWSMEGPQPFSSTPSKKSPCSITFQEQTSYAQALRVVISGADSAITGTYPREHQRSLSLTPGMHPQKIL